MEAEVQTDAAASRVKLETWLVTDVGMVREHNEDSAYMDPSHGFFIVADGMGGHAAGEVASAMAVETVRKTLEQQRAELTAFTSAPTDVGRRALVQLLQNAVLQAHQAVYQRGQSEPDKAGMGTTLDVVVVAGPEAFVAHVGDSRTYLIRDGRTSQITTDHTVAEVLVIEGKLTIEEAQVSPLRTILVNAIGVSADVGVEMAHVTLKRGDRLLLCSDGLHDYFPSEEEIASKLSEEQPGEALREMVELAKTRGGHDNITGVVCQVTDVGDSVPGSLDGESTQPVDAQKANPFTQDEVTETAVIPTATDKLLGAKLNEISQSSVRATQPMRAYAHADTLPPDDSKAAGGDKVVVKPDPGAQPHAATVEAKVPPELLARAKSKSTPPPVGEDAGKGDAKPEAKADAKPDDGKPEPSDGTPTADIATADTGRARAAKAEADGKPAPAPNDDDKTAELKPAGSDKKD